LNYSTTENKKVASARPSVAARAERLEVYVYSI